MAGDYASSMTRQAGARTIGEARMRADSAFRAGQRDAEQGWSCDPDRWGFKSLESLAYARGFASPRVVDNNAG